MAIERMQLAVLLGEIEALMSSLQSGSWPTVEAVPIGAGGLSIRRAGQELVYLDRRQADPDIVLRVVERATMALQQQFIGELEDVRGELEEVMYGEGE